MVTPDALFLVFSFDCDIIHARLKIFTATPSCQQACSITSPVACCFRQRLASLSTRLSTLKLMVNVQLVGQPVAAIVLCKTSTLQFRSQIIDIRSVSERLPPAVCPMTVAEQLRSNSSSYQSIHPVMPREPVQMCGWSWQILPSTLIRIAPFQ